MDIKCCLCKSGGKIIDGRKINEDRVKVINITNNNSCYKFAILMDGASGLGKNNTIVENKTSAEWFVDFMLEQIEKEICESPTDSIKNILKKCVKRAKNIIDSFQKLNNIKLEKYEIPSASLAMLKDDGTNVEIFLLGDTVTLLKYKKGNKVEIVKNPNQEAVSKNDNEVLKRAKEISIEQNISVKMALQEKEIIGMLQNNRSKKNCKCTGGYYILGTDEDAIEHGVLINIDNERIEGIILLTDGLDYSILEIDENETYDIIKNNGFEYLLDKIRIKELEDSDYNINPRFKISDDASGIFIENTYQKIKK